MIHISEGIGKTKKGHSIDGPHRPRLRGNRQHHHAQAHTGGGTKLPEDHFGGPLFSQRMTSLYRMRCGPEQAGFPRFGDILASDPARRRSGFVRAAVKRMMWRRPRLPAKSKIADFGFGAFDLKPQRAAGGEDKLHQARGRLGFLEADIQEIENERLVSTMKAQARNLRLPAVTGAIVGARNARQAEGVMQLKLTPEDIAEIEGTAPAGR
jgi:hypothetical protein